MKTSLILGLPMMLLTTALIAQTDPMTPGTPGSPARTTPPPTTNYNNTPSSTYNNTPVSSYDAAEENRGGAFGAVAGDHEFTLSGTGASNKDFDNSAGGVGASFGVYLNDTLSLSVRQTVDYINPDGGDDGWAASTSVAIDQHFGTARLRPFVGASLGFLYGDEIDDSFFAGLEGGLKFYVQPRTFLFAQAEYLWAFEDSDDADDTFEDGGFRWTVGVGFNF